MGLIHLDAGVLIGFLDSDDAHHEPARQILTDALHEGHQLAMAASAFAEVLVGPARRGQGAVDTVRGIVERIPISIVPIDNNIAISAARLRAVHRALRLPDALVIAVAMNDHADHLVTTDRRWPTARALKLTGTLKRL